MKIDRTKFTAQYENGAIKSMWVSIEVSMDSGMGEDPKAALDLSKKISDEWYNQQGGWIYSAPIHEPGGPSQEIQVKKEPEDIRIGVIAEDILSCKDLPTIDSYKLIIKGKPELEKAYEKRRKEIVGAEVKDIINKTEALTSKKQ